MPGMERYLEREDFGAVQSAKLLKHGDSSAPIIKELLSPHLGTINFHYGNILKTAKPSQPIEIAFFDCLKSVSLDLAVIKAFAPQYIPEHRIVVQQDYFYEGSVSNKIRQEFFSGHFEYLGSVATSAIFLLHAKSRANC